MPGHAAGDNPNFIAPMLATVAATLPADAAEFIAEVKCDGYGPASPWRASGPGPDPGTAVTSPPPLPSSACSRPRRGHRTLALDGEIVALSGAAAGLHRAQRRMSVGGAARTCCACGVPKLCHVL